MTMFYATLDASPFITGSQGERVRFGEDLVHHLKRDGFIKLTNHGIPEDFLRDIFAWVRYRMRIKRLDQADQLHCLGTTLL